MDHRFDDTLFDNDLELLKIEAAWEESRTAVINAAKELKNTFSLTHPVSEIRNLLETVEILEKFEAEHPHMISSGSGPMVYGVDYGAEPDETAAELVSFDIESGGLIKTPLDPSELSELREEMHLSSLGDRPHSIAAKKLKRLIILETEEKHGHK